MTRFSTQRFNLRARPWLVLWLLPYLVLSIAASGHSHGFGETHGSASASALAASPTETVASVVTAIADETAHAAHELWCLACQWAGFVSVLLAPASTFLTLVASSLLFALLALSPTRRSLARATVRGPPSL